MNVGEVAGQTVPHCRIARADDVSSSGFSGSPPEFHRVTHSNP